ncbi:LysE family translocator [Corynebacterium comes]|uniref:Leucine efflux protein n=1 Tax=Corynebacterium comes TaxID=2675218 RepID=A0A6B8W3H9_9CORY|nr:LysE family translocator [Corynebacterium comes]QGU05486.1 Leucine efflux protein [Corynebacterium comes]
MDIANLLSFWAVSLLLIVTPGPDWAFVLGHAFRRRPLIWPLLGIGLGYLGLTFVVSGGLGALVARHPALLSIVTVLGVIVLLRIGWTMVRAALSGQVAVAVEETAPAAEPRGGGVATLTRTDAVVDKRKRIIATGAAVSGLNPKGLMLFIALLPQFVAPAAWPVTAQMFVLGLVFIVSATCFYALLGIFAGRVLAGSAQASRILTGVAGGAMMVVAAAMLAQHFL